MRTTVTLDEDVAKLVQDRMRNTGASFKKAINDLLREGTRERTEAASTYALPTHDLQPYSWVNLDKARHVLDELEDEEKLRTMEASLRGEPADCSEPADQ